jgi:CoA:oxalate CoA-transferase
MSSPSKPLAGVRVLDLSRVFAGPVAGRTLSDLGADVVKVEPPEGDISRLWGRKVAGLSTYFTQQNCGKRNVCVDLLADGGPELVAELAGSADVVLENFRPGVLARFGLDWPQLSARNKRLIMLSISGFGQHGPEAQRAAYASIIHAEAGVIDQDMVDPIDISISAADVLSGMHGVIGVLAALRERDVSGSGQFIDLAMVDAMTFSNDLIVHSLDDSPPGERLKGEIWQTAGGPMMLTGGLRWIWHSLSKTHGLTDPTPSDAALDVKISSRRSIVSGFLSSLADRASVTAALDAANLPWGEIRQGRDVLESPTMNTRGSVVDVDDRAGSTRQVVRAPYRMSVSDTSDVGVAAHRGEHNVQVLDEWLGASPSRIEALTAADILLADEWTDALNFESTRD